MKRKQQAKAAPSPGRDRDLALEEIAQQVGRRIGLAVESFNLANPNRRRVGFAMLVFDFGPGGHMAYTSNVDRQDLANALREMATNLDAGAPLDTPGRA